MDGDGASPFTVSVVHLGLGSLVVQSMYNTYTSTDLNVHIILSYVHNDTVFVCVHNDLHVVCVYFIF